MSVLVAGILRYPDNSPIAGASLKFIASKFISSGVPIGASLEIVTDSIGVYSQQLLEGSYHIFYKKSGQELYTHIIDAHLLAGMGGVAIGDPITIEGIVGTLPGDTPIYTGCDTIPAPSAFTTASGFTTILLSWEGTAYSCHAVTEIWISATSNFDNKALLDTTEAKVYSHNLGHDASRHYWIRFRNLNGDYGNWFSSTGVAGQTSQDPGMVLEDLQQDIYNSSIFSSLRSNINSSFYQADAPTTKPNGDSLVSGDTWIDSDDNQRHVWDTSQVPPAWLAVTDKETLAVVQALVGTQEVADGEIRGFFQTTEPLFIESSFGDIWINTGLTTPLTFTAIKRFEADDSSSTGTLSWRSAPSSALGLSYVKAFNTEGDLSTLQNSYSTFVNTTLPADLSVIQAQIDGSITTWFKDIAPTLSNAPASSWSTPETKIVHLGDLYYDRVTGSAYRFAYEDIDDTPDAGVIYSWVQITDTDVTAALANAQTAQDTADDKRRVFVVQPTPPYDVGDLWTTGTELKRCKLAKVSGTYLASNWEVATNYVTTYYTNKSPAPSAPHVGDLWVVLDEADALYRYTGTAWQLLSVATLANVDTQITEQVGYCEFTDTTGTEDVTTYYAAHATKSTCEAATSTDGTFAWNNSGAIGGHLRTVSTTVDTNTAAVQVNAESINGVQAEYSVKLDVNGHVSGFGLSAGQVCVDNTSGDIIYDADGVTITDATICTAASGTIKTDSTFIVAADTFAITGTDETPITPFIVRTGDADGSCYVNGVENTALDETACGETAGGSWVPPNSSVVGIQGSLVLDGTMNANAIVAGSITGDHIAGTTITGDNIDAGSISASHINTDGLNASVITSGTIAAEYLSAFSVEANRIISNGDEDAFDISSFGDAGPDGDANIYGGVIKGAIIEGGYLVATGDNTYTSSYKTSNPNCSHAERINGVWRYPKVFGNILASPGFSTAQAAGTYTYDFHAWDKCNSTLRRLDTATVGLTLAQVDDLLDKGRSFNASGTSHSFDDTFKIITTFAGAAVEFKIRVYSAFNSSDWFAKLWVDGVIKKNHRAGGAGDTSYSGDFTRNGITYSIYCSFSGEDSWGGSYGDHAYNLSVDSAASVINNITFTGNEVFKFVTSGTEMKIPAATLIG